MESVHEQGSKYFEVGKILRYSKKAQQTKSDVDKSSFVMEKGRTSDVKDNEARLVVYGNEEDGYHEENFSLIKDYTALELILCISMRKTYCGETRTL